MGEYDSEALFFSGLTLVVTGKKEDGLRRMDEAVATTTPSSSISRALVAVVETSIPRRWGMDG